MFFFEYGAYFDTSIFVACNFINVSSYDKFSRHGVCYF